jgi:hypothetical protein
MLEAGGAGPYLTGGSPYIWGCPAILGAAVPLTPSVLAPNKHLTEQEGGNTIER